ncbi:MAG: Maf-like protein [marine bacterium B5-7]|nr:MAG: Maf-like protein [marine bacterium B5-7]
MKIYLASRSPRRRELLDQIGVEFQIIDIDIDESWDGKEKPENYVQRIALEKARAGNAFSDEDFPVLAADTAVILEGQILGKAENREDAAIMLKKLSGKTHTVLSAVSLIHKHEKCLLNISNVTFKKLSQSEITNYCETDEPIGKAGGYAIQGTAAVFIKHLEGSYSGVMGLPLFETQKLLHSIS